MKYLKASNVLPEHLVLLIQDYIDGEYLYIPRKKGNEKNWGEASGVKEELSLRNHQIYCYYCDGADIAFLAEKYFLSEKTISNIISIEKKNMK